MFGSRGKLGAAIGVAAFMIALTGASAEASAELVPWGAGCVPVPAGATRTSANCGAALVGDRAVAPAEAPVPVKETIAAANRIDHTPYVWGGGHLSWVSRGYDCSGAVGYALHGAGMLGETMVSGQLESWGDPGVGRWITIYANAEHVFMVIAGLRFDTRDDPPGVSGPRWHPPRVDTSGFVARHPPGL